MFQPKYSINNAILKHISSIEAAREMINNAPLIPVWEKRFAEDAVVRMVHFGTHLEGNPLELDEVRKIIEGKKVLAHERDVQEIINYRRAMDYLEEAATSMFKEKKEDEKTDVKYDTSQLKQIHKLTVARILPEEKSGKIRQTRVVIKNSRTGEVTFSPPPPIELPYQLEAFFDWLNASEGKEIHSVLRAGMAHFELVRIHPFIDGNGRVARAFSTFVLYCESYDIKRFFSLEEHFDKDAAAYYSILQKTPSGSGSLTDWLEYFTKSLAIEFGRIKEKIIKLSSDYDFKSRLGKQVTISDRQEKLIRYMKRHEQLLMKYAKKRILPDISDDTILRELTDLMKKGIVKKVGKTKAAKYKLS